MVGGLQKGKCSFKREREVRFIKFKGSHDCKKRYIKRICGKEDSIG